MVPVCQPSHRHVSGSQSECLRYASRMTALSADQASFMLHTLGLPALQAEHRMTTAVIAAIPSGRGEDRPHADPRSAFDLAWHIVSAEIKYLDAIAAGVFPHELPTVPSGLQQTSD